MLSGITQTVIRLGGGKGGLQVLLVGQVQYFIKKVSARKVPFARQQQTAA